jgi:predicted negative regulator of RcsB-dependent stress response
MADHLTPSKPPVAVLEYEPSAFENLLIQHKPKLILVGLLAILGTTAYWGQRLWSEHKQKEAALSFVRAETVADLKKTAADHGSEAGAGSALVLAASLLSADRPGEAVDTLKEFISKFPNHPLRDLAAFRIGDYLLQSPDKAGAEKELETVAATGSIYAPIALLRLGDLKWAAGDTEAAKKFYDKILTTPAFAGSPVRAEAQTRVDSKIKQKPPVLVDFVPEAPPTPAADPSAAGFNVDSLLGDPPATDPKPADDIKLSDPAPAADPAADLKPADPTPADAKPAAEPAPAPTPAADAKPAAAPKPAEPAAK